MQQKIEHDNQQIRYTQWKPIRNCNEIFAISDDKVYSEDIEIYVDLIIRKVAREFKVDFNYAEGIIREENKPFFLVKQKFYSERNSYNTWSDTDRLALENLFKLFYIPVKNDNIADEIVNVDKVIDLFNLLSDMEKLQFLTRIEKVSITVDKI